MLALRKNEEADIDIQKYVQLMLLAAVGSIAAGSAKSQAMPAKPAVRYCSNCATITAILRSEGKLAKPYQVVIRLSDGQIQTILYANDPGLSVGDKVKLRNGVLTLDQ